MQRTVSEFQNLPQVPQTSDCPSAEEIAASLSPNATPSEVARIVNHCSTCPPCAEDWRVARALSQSLAQTLRVLDPDSSPSWIEAWPGATEAPSNDVQTSGYEPDPVSQASEDSPHGPWLKRANVRKSAGLCAVACVFALLVFGTIGPLPKPEVMRGDNTSQSPQQSYSFQSRSFVWPDFEPGAEYQVSVFNDAGERILDLEYTRETSQRISPTALDRIEAKKAAYWQVRTLHGSGRVSPVISLDLRSRL